MGEKTITLIRNIRMENDTTVKLYHSLDNLHVLDVTKEVCSYWFYYYLKHNELVICIKRNRIYDIRWEPMARQRGEKKTRFKSIMMDNKTRIRRTQIRNRRKTLINNTRMENKTTIKRKLLSKENYWRVLGWRMRLWSRKH